MGNLKIGLKFDIVPNLDHTTRFRGRTGGVLLRFRGGSEPSKNRDFGKFPKIDFLSKLSLIWSKIQFSTFLEI